MKINIQEIKFAIKVAKDIKRPDLLAYASVKFIDEHERQFSVNGFTIRKSQYDGKPYLADPTRKTFTGVYKFVLIEDSLRKEIEREVIKQYEYEIIPIIDK